MSESLYLPTADGWAPTLYTRGPWDARFQHGGPPAALLTGAMARHGDGAGDFRIARVTVELLRPVPLRLCVVDVGLTQSGRTVERLEATLSVDGRVCLHARALRIRARALGTSASPSVAAWADPTTLTDFTFPFFAHDVGYHRAVQLRIAHGEWGSTPIGLWTRTRVPLVPDRPSTPLERLMILADAQSGMGVPLSPFEYTFVNPDLTVLIERPPASDWIGFDVRSAASSDSTGLSESAVRDLSGAVGRSAQTLVVAAR